MPTEIDQEDRGRFDRERDFHDEAFAEGVRSRAGKFYAITRARDDEFRRRLQPLAAGDVLEYGCGPGHASYLLPPPAGCRLTAIDISPVAVDLARTWAAENSVDGVSFKVMNAEELEFDADSFDLVTGRGILHHLELNRAYSEIARVLRPGGRALFIEPLGVNPLINLYRRATPAMRTVDEHPFLEGDIALATEYFGQVSAEFFHLTSLLAVPLRNTPIFPSALSVFERIDAALLKRPRVRLQAWYSVLEFGEPLRSS